MTEASLALLFYLYLPWWLGLLTLWIGVLTYLCAYRYPVVVLFNGYILSKRTRRSPGHYGFARGNLLLYIDVRRDDIIEVRRGWFGSRCFTPRAKTERVSVVSK